MVVALMNLNVRRLHFSEALFRLTVVYVQFIGVANGILVLLCMRSQATVSRGLSPSAARLQEMISCPAQR
jgi:hypothetical protein